MNAGRTRVVEKQRVIWSCILHKPMHRPNNVCFGRLACRILLIVRQDNHILQSISVPLIQEALHVFDIIDTASQLSALPKVIDSNQQGLPSSSTLAGDPFVIETRCERLSLELGSRCIRIGAVRST